MRRLMLGMSQERLADQLGITFQQVQKYEKGVNRISASRLQHSSQILDVPVSFFFEQAPQLTAKGRGLAESPAAYIDNPVLRRSIVGLVEGITSASAGRP
jgi:transcriptional regulator with XRE-family HTH domain